MFKIEWPDLKLPPINLWNVWKLQNDVCIITPVKAVSNEIELNNPKLKIINRIVNDRY